MAIWETRVYHPGWVSLPCAAYPVLRHLITATHSSEDWPSGAGVACSSQCEVFTIPVFD